MLVTSDIGYVSCLRMGGSSICQYIYFFCPLADFVIDVIFLIFFRSNHCSQMSFTLSGYLNVCFSIYPNSLFQLILFDN